MNKFLVSALIVSFTTLSALPVVAQQETRKVCVDVKDKEGKPVKDPKTGNTKQICKDVKVHKKLEGTEVPKK
jgi:hypothetical protein